MGYRVAVVGATGNVGREVLNILAERKFPADEVFALASSRSIGKELSYGDKVLKAKDLQQRLERHKGRDLRKGVRSDEIRAHRLHGPRPIVRPHLTSPARSVAASEPHTGRAIGQIQGLGALSIEAFPSFAQTH